MNLFFSFHLSNLSQTNSKEQHFGLDLLKIPIQFLQSFLAFISRSLMEKNRTGDLGRISAAYWFSSFHYLMNNKGH